MAEKLGPIEEKRKNWPNWRRIVAVAMLGLALLSGCVSKFDEGDVLVAKDNVVVVTDWNDPRLWKPECTIHEGDRVTVTGFSTLSLGSTEKQGLIELSGDDCVGWAFDEPKLNKLFEKVDH